MKEIDERLRLGPLPEDASHEQTMEWAAALAAMLGYMEPELRSLRESIARVVEAYNTRWVEEHEGGLTPDPPPQEET